MVILLMEELQKCIEQCENIDRKLESNYDYIENYFKGSIQEVNRNVVTELRENLNGMKEKLYDLQINGGF